MKELPTPDASASGLLLQVSQISKRFPGVCALDQVNLFVQPGEVLGVVGENGAGKSTLMKILAGLQQPDSGSLLMDGQTVRFASSRQAMQHGIVLIHQELSLCDNLNVAQNIFLGREPRWGPFIRSHAMTSAAARLLATVGLNVSPRTPTHQLTVGRQQMVEIAKALSVEARVIIFDEPTSSLTSRESEHLFKMIDTLRQRGCGVIYISHRLEEVCRLADRVEVLRDGRNAGALARSEINHDAMVRLMVGRALTRSFDRTAHPLAEEAFRVEGLATAAHPSHRINFSLRRGEIVGIAGLVGAGRTELLQALFGIEQPRAGRIFVAGKAVEIRSPLDAIQAGLALVPEDRKRHGLHVECSIRKNIGLPGLGKFRRWGALVNARREKRDSIDAVERLRVKTDSDGRLAQFLSGGNQQKVVIGKWLSMEPRVLLLDEPTRGIDVGAKQEIYRLIESLAAGGMSILFVSSELEELMGLADRALVMHEGRLSGELPRAQFSEENLMRLATGQSEIRETDKACAIT